MQETNDSTHFNFCQCVELYQRFFKQEEMIMNVLISGDIIRVNASVFIHVIIQIL